MIKPEDFEFSIEDSDPVRGTESLQGKFEILSKTSYNRRVYFVEARKAAQEQIIRKVVEEFYPRSLRLHLRELYHYARIGAQYNSGAERVETLMKRN